MVVCWLINELGLLGIVWGGFDSVWLLCFISCSRLALFVLFC